MKTLTNFIAVFKSKSAQASKRLAATTVLTCLMASSVQASGLMVPKGSNTVLQIKDHSVTVAIEDGYAITTVENQFYNPSNQDLEAVYEFPVPEGGTVAEFTLWIDGTPVIGEVVEKERAKKLYQEEKAAGRDVGLTEKKSFYRFESSVSPVRAQQVTKTRLVYLQAADVQGGIGRYVYPLEDGETDTEKQKFWKTDTKVTGQFSFDLNLRSGFPVDALRAPAHASHASISNVDSQNWALSINKNGRKPVNDQAISTQQASGTQTLDSRSDAFADLETQEQSQVTSNELNQDIVVYWRLAPNLPGAIELVAHKEPNEKRGTFMLTVTPGIDLQPITEGRDWVFVLDRSGSMSGKYSTLMDATEQALKQLGTNDRFKIVLFSSYIEELTPDWVTADQISIETVSQALSSSRTDGGTDMYAGIEAAIKGLDSDRTSSIVLITDGVANLGKTEKKDFLDLMGKHDVRLFTGVMGNGANRPLLNSICLLYTSPSPRD